MTDQLPDDAVLKRLQGLLNLAAKNSSPEEAASAAAKAQELLARYNLDAHTVENATAVKDGRREKALVDGGAYQHQRDLWRAVAQLNFCLYWTQSYEVWDKRRIMRDPYDGRRHLSPGWVVRKRHMLVGKIVNTRATQALAGYLAQAVERNLMERLHGDANEKNLQRFSSWAASYRKGATRRVIEKVEAKRSELLQAQLKAQQAAKARAERAGVSTATTLTVADVVMAEYNENVDFVYGEGTSAAWAAERAEAARKRREEREAQTRWAAEHPEEAAAKAAKQREKVRKERVYTSARDHEKNPGAYWDGYDAADAIGLDQQVGGERVAGRLR